MEKVTEIFFTAAKQLLVLNFLPKFGYCPRLVKLQRFSKIDKKIDFT